jgi:glycosyltransferase involved in cell wall biosynthesis
MRDKPSVANPGIYSLLFAALSFIFRVSFLIYFILLGVFSSTFAKYVIIPGSIPLLPTELLISLWLLYKVSQALRGEKFLVYPFSVTVVSGILALGVLNLVRKPDAFALRYSMMFFYVVLAFITCDFLKSTQDFKRIIQAAKVAIILSWIFTLLNLPTSISQIHFGSITSTSGVYYLGIGNFGVYFLVFCWAIFECYLYPSFSGSHSPIRSVVWMLLCLCWVLLFYFHRSALLAFVFAPGIFLIARPVRLLKGLPKTVALAILCILIVILSSTYFNKNKLVDASAIYDRLYSILTPEKDTHTSWRLFYWQKTLSDISTNPGHLLWGKGFSLTPFERVGYTEGNLLTAPVTGFHNSFLTVIYKTGILGLFFITLFFGKTLLISLRERDPSITIAGMSLLAMVIFAFFNVVLENPYYGFFMWFYAGMIYKLKYLKKKDQIRIRQGNTVERNLEEGALKKIKILLIGSTPPPYHGSSIYFKDFLETLANCPALEVLHVETSDKRNDLNNLGKLDFKNISTALSSLVREAYLCARYKPQIVYIPIAQNTFAYLRDGLFILVGKVFKTKVVIHLHGSYFRNFYDQSPAYIKKFIDVTLRACDGAIVLGDKLRWIFEKWLPPYKIFVLPNCVAFQDTLNLQRQDHKRPKVLTYLGNLYESRGIFDLLEAIKIVNEKAKGEFILQVAGKFVDDPFTSLRYEAIQRKFDEYVKVLNGVLKYLGQITTVEDKYRLFKDTDLFVFPSWYEGQPLVILEAMAMGCAVISTKDVGVIDETVVDGVTGILVEKQNPEKLAEAILFLLKNPELLVQMGKAGRKRYEAYYTPERILEKVLHIFKTLLDLPCAA